MLSGLDRYERIAPFYDLLDQPFEWKRYRALRPLLFESLTGRLLDAGVGTGRNFPFYPAASAVVGIDISPAMLARAERRRAQSRAALELMQMDVTDLPFAAGSFDAAVSSFLFCVLPDEQQVPALRTLGRMVKPGGPIRLLEYVRPAASLRRVLARIWEPWMHFAYGASFDRHTEQRVPEAGLRVVSSRFVVPDLIKLIDVRSAGQ
jgi:ubiquinone/menaquinone biosynthesis C-methylase UbiE